MAFHKKEIAPNTVIRGFKVRLYPTAEQEALIREFAYRCRKVWNWALYFQLERHKNNESRLDAGSLVKELQKFKRLEGNEALRATPALSLNAVIHTLDESFIRFSQMQKRLKASNQPCYPLGVIRRCIKTDKKPTEYQLLGHPKFKREQDSIIAYRPSYQAICFDGEYVKLEKLSKVRFSYNYPGLVLDKTVKVGSRPTVSFKNGKWILSFTLCIPKQPRELTDSVMGINLGVNTMAVTSCDGEERVYDSLIPSKEQHTEKAALLAEKIRRIEVHINSLQEQLSRSDALNADKLKESGVLHTNRGSIIKQKLRKLYAKIANIRRTYINQFTHEAVEQLPKAICIDDIPVSEFIKKPVNDNADLNKPGFNRKKYAKNLAASNLYELRRQLDYKCEERSIDLIVVDKSFQSTRTCSACGAENPEGDLTKRKYYVCSKCGAKIDKEINAARNLEAIAKRKKQ